MGLVPYKVDDTFNRSSFPLKVFDYLASGRPVVAQDTGFSQFLPTGRGLFAFDSVDGVLDAIAMLRHDYQAHARAARAIAEEQFDSDIVLRRLLTRLGLCA